MSVGTFFNRRWWWTTLLVIAAMAVLVRLGLWQLDRLEQRREKNAQTAAQLAQPPIQLETLLQSDLDPLELHNRKATGRGSFDYQHQLVIKSQLMDGQPGVYIVTPMVLAGGDQAILVNRGWVPFNLADAEFWPQYTEPAAETWTGFLQKSQKMPNGSTTQIPDTPQTEWYRLDIEAIQTQMPYKLLPVYLVLQPEDGRSREQLPRRVKIEFDLGEGNHMSYALQWFSFALILGIGYITYVRSHERSANEPIHDATESAKPI
jgi:surfeit locus 1 family protein